MSAPLPAPLPMKPTPAVLNISVTDNLGNTETRSIWYNQFHMDKLNETLLAECNNMSFQKDPIIKICRYIMVPTAEVVHYDFNYTLSQYDEMTFESDIRSLNFIGYFNLDDFIEYRWDGAQDQESFKMPLTSSGFPPMKITINIQKKQVESLLQQPSTPSYELQKQAALQLAYSKQESIAEDKRRLALPVTSFVFLVVSHGSTVGPDANISIPYPTDDFRRVFFHGKTLTDLNIFDHPDFTKFFGNKHTKFALKDVNYKLLMNLDNTPNPFCNYEHGNLFLPPIIFSMETVDLTENSVLWETTKANIMGIYLYTIRNDPTKQNTVYTTREHIFKYSDLKPGFWITYSDIFLKISQYITLHKPLSDFIKRTPDNLIISFFCCRGRNPSIVERYAALPEAVNIPNPIVIMHSMVGIDVNIERFDAPINDNYLFVVNINSRYTIENLCHSMNRQLFVKDFTIDPITGEIRPLTWVNWQGCLYNLLCFFKIISRECADALTAVSTYQQIRQISTGRRIVSGESIDNAIFLFNEIVRNSLQIAYKFVKCRIPIIQGCITICYALQARLDIDTQQVIFLKLYSQYTVPSDTSTLSEIGHWVAITKFIIGGIHTYYYIDVQSNKFLSFNHISQLYSLIYPTYTCMDLIYVVPQTGSLPAAAQENPHTPESLARDLIQHPISQPLLTVEAQIQSLQPVEPVFHKFVAELRVALDELDDDDGDGDNGSEAVYHPSSAREAAAAARAAQGNVDDGDDNGEHFSEGGQYYNTKITRKLKTYRSKKNISKLKGSNSKKHSKKNKAKKQSRKRLYFFK